MNNRHLPGLKILGVSATQVVGGFFCVALYYVNGKFGTLSLFADRIILVVTAVPLLCAFYVLWTCDPIVDLRTRLKRGISELLDFVWKALKRELPDVEQQQPAVRPPYPDGISVPATTAKLHRILIFFALLDFFSLTVAMCYTGGARESVYAPLLFAVVPILIFVNVLRWWELCICATLSAVLFTLGFWLDGLQNVLCPFPFSITKGGHSMHSFWIWASTTIGALFPVFYSIVEKFADRN
jgi:hypothetical protein